MPSMPAKTAAPGDDEARSPMKQQRRVGDLLQAGIGHLEDADLGGRAEAVLHRAEHAEMMAGVALEIEHGVDHVLDHARSGDLAVLGDMADQHDCGLRRLGVADQRLRGGAHLRHGAGRAFGEIGPQRLDGIDDRRGRPAARPASVARMSSTCVSAASSTGASREAEPLGAQPDLARSPPRRRYRPTRLPARASGAAAWIRMVDLPMPGSPPTRSAEPGTKPPPVTRSNSAMPLCVRRKFVGRAGKRHELHRLAARRAERHRRGRAGLLGQRVPLAAGIAAALPARRNRAAIRADILCARLRHQAEPGPFR